MNKINFTTEHEAQLDELSLKLLKNGTLMKGNIGSEYSVHDILHNLSLNSTIEMHNVVKKQVQKMEETDDEWSLDTYKQIKLARMKEVRDFMHLVIGWKKFKSQEESRLGELRNKKAELAKLRLETMTPDEKIKAAEAEIVSLGGTLD